MNHIPVFYTTRLVADSQSFSPSSSKPALVVDSWSKLGIPIEFHEPAPVTREELCLAHGASYVNGVLECKSDNGFGNRLPEVAASLPYTSGAFVAAAREALRNGKTAVAPVSGFHHACHDHGGGYCTFNGLVVAAQVLKRDGRVNKAGILDCDQHYGNGTAEIINKLNLRDWLQHTSAGKVFWDASQAEKFLHILPALVGKFAGCDVLFYQAGADPHIDDPLGGWLTTEQLERRDRIVFETCKKLGLPIAWNLAGGYQTPLRRVLDIHDNTLLACAATYGVTVAQRAGSCLTTLNLT